MYPEVSIITPVYNSEKYISLTIESVLAQSFTSWEMILVDDNSNDNSVEVIEKLIDGNDKFKLISSNENFGAAISRNKGLECAQGRFIAFIDSDDCWMPEKLEKQIAFMKQSQYAITFTSYELIDDSGVALNKTVDAVDVLNLKQYLKNTIIGLSTAVLDTNLLKNKVIFNNLRTRQDADLWINLLKQGHLAYGLKKPLSLYRVHSKSISSNKVKAAKQVWNLYYNIHKFGLFSSAYYFVHYAINAIAKRL